MSSDIAVCNFNGGLKSILQIIRVLEVEIGPQLYNFCIEADVKRVQRAEASLSDAAKEARANRSRKEADDEFLNLAVKVTRPTVGSDYLVSPITGEKIPASKVQEHMRIGLLDPRWVEQRDKQVMDKMNQETVYAAGSAIDASLKLLAERRTDIFGVGDEETAIGKKIGEEDVRKDEKVTWDGHTSSVEAATRAARANITLEEQIHQIHKVKGLLPDEEKEKIGPKNIGIKSGKANIQSVIISKPQNAPPQKN
ncbi:hypothetical protein NQ318_007073 [Aromia moschata]|uniref:Splicing factor 3A subunit 1 conserved domain-containing protein n=1 Tax=Aromia moschata TaxID=1265417 RepID=A0AAV8X8I7_9CUCU|nr:hypothetical protein NQ318_007073 [Aromia moschata]